MTYAKAHATLHDVQRERYVRLFRNGRNQALRIPREFELPGEEAVLRKEGDRLVIEPAPHRSLLQVLAGLTPITESFPSIADAAPETSPFEAILAGYQCGIRSGR